jgi:elongation factor 3
VDEEEARAAKWCIDGVRGDVRRVTDPKEDPKKAKQDLNNVVIPDAILNRRNKKKEKTMEYEVKWQFKPLEDNVWVERDILIKMGYLKMVQREDEKQAAAAGLQTKQLTQPGIEKHLGNFGVDPESASHTQINQLSGGMKVKVVLAAAMWQSPHILILDEPTNYLDREGLGALVLAIQDYKGGVLIISHNKEFCDGVAQEKWIMNKGYLRIEGESKADEADEEASGNKVQEDIVDASGNKIDMNAVDNSSDKDKKKKLKELEKKLKDGVKKKTLTDEEKWALEDQILEVKEKLEAKKAA